MSFINELTQWPVRIPMCEGVMKAASMTSPTIDRTSCCTLFGAVVALTLSASGPAFSEDDPKLDSKAQQTAPTAFAADKPKPVLNWGEGDGKNYLVPAFGIVAFDFLLNQYDRHFIDSETFGSDFSSFKKNLKGKWVYDNDPFSVNQFLHPYQGSMYFGFARSAGLDYWRSLGYTVAGSLLWETAGETDPPSINDQFTTGFGGTFLGEPLFRMASLLLESGGGRPGFWRELGAAALSPSTGFNRLVFGKRFDGVFRSHDPAVYTRAQLGANVNASVNSNVNRNPRAEEPAVPQGYKRGEVIADFTITYGLPGKPGYDYERPFDYFHFQFTAASSNALENLMSHGLLYGADYSIGADYRGVWGLYGVYDYIAPQIFRISNTGAGLGTSAQWWLSKKVALQGTVLAGVGYGSGGTIRGIGERDYHTGITPNALATSRLIFSDRAAFEMELRDYYVSDKASSESGGSENIARGVAALTVRVHNLHGITLKYTVSRRDAKYSNLADTRQTVGAVSLGYTFLGQTRFGAVDWRPKSEGGP